MTRSDREKWDARYREGSYSTRTHPSTLLTEWLPRLPRGRALDVACGAGRNALALAAAGYRVDAIDISPVALARARATALSRGLDIRWLEADLDSPDWNAPLAAMRYDLIVWVRYVNTALMPALIEHMADGAWLVCEQHLSTSLGVAGPSNPAFRLPANALLKSAAGLRVPFYREGPLEDPDGRVVALARLIACKPAAGTMSVGEEPQPPFDIDAPDPA